MCADCPSRLARDREAAFPDFVRHHQDLVYGTALRLVRRHADAEDLAQETFVRAYRALERWDPERVVQLRARGWLAAIVQNLVRDRARRAALRTHDGAEPVSLDEAQAGWAGRRALDADVRHEPEARAVARESAVEWATRLAGLPEAWRKAVELRHVEGLSYPELSEALGRPVGTVKSDVHRGVAMLRARWLEEQARSGPGTEARA